MKKIQRKIISVSYLYMWYRFMLIYINFNFDFLGLDNVFLKLLRQWTYKMSRFLSCLQHSRPCCIGYTNSRLRLEFVYPIQHGRSCCKHYLYYCNFFPTTVIFFLHAPCGNQLRLTGLAWVNKVFLSIYLSIYGKPHLKPYSFTFIMKNLKIWLMTILENVFKSNFKRWTYFHIAINNSRKVELSNFTHGLVVLILSFRKYNNFGIRKFAL